VGHRRAALALLLAFGAGFVLIALMQPGLEASNALPDGIVVALFVLNVLAVAAITLVLIDAAWGGREGTLASMRGLSTATSPRTWPTPSWPTPIARNSAAPPPT
jgi:hypothetical protein